MTKSNLILGMGETREEVSSAMRDLHDAGTEILTITQYLRPCRAITRSTAGSAPRSSSSWPTRPGHSVSPAYSAGRWSGPPYRAGRLYREALATRDQIDLELVGRSERNG